MRSGETLVVILDDDEERVVEMRAALSSLRMDISIRHFDNAPDLLQVLGSLVASARVLSLDHDLGPLRERDGQRFDPGIGRAITEALAGLAPACPVVLHTSNGPAAEGMLNDLRFSGWRAVRVVPHGDLEWIRKAWLPAVTGVLDDGQDG